MNRKAKGTKNGHRSMRLLKSMGYACTRAAASPVVWDVVAIGSRDVILLQVKSRDWPGSVEMETLKGFVCPPLCKKIIHRWVDRKRLRDVREI